MATASTRLAHDGFAQRAVRTLKLATRSGVPAFGVTGRGATDRRYGKARVAVPLPLVFTAVSRKNRCLPVPGAAPADATCFAVRVTDRFAPPTVKYLACRP
ncbi:hypothetical protein GCM10025868_47060 [Angustibacter aerolatus]|uniref:Uncharacterized protein n=1 Tax=Angustibacter aerolatus TaxID=1162965 RepID=A0ABQ6JME5_9ACTN|nr:hypothetical protein [Angustibacter aerolatus]GMA89456.1 hypothetical protein GCM10025868_47060 [Angustibacter aerolatus]